MQTPALGTVISTFEGPSTSAFHFVLTEPTVRRGQYVQVETANGPLIAFVGELVRANRYFERAESVSEYEKQARTKEGAHSFLTEFPARDWEYVLAQCKVMGIFENGTLGRVGVPPSPGDRVHEVPESLLSEFSGFVSNGLELGTLLQHSVQARIDLTRLLQKHVAVLGISGSGKSHSVGVLLEELLDRKTEDGRLAVVAFDVHGEYVGFADARRNPQYAKKTLVVDGQKIRIATHKLNSRMLAEFIPELSATQGRELDKIIRGLKHAMKEGGAAFDLGELVQAVDKSSMKENVKGPLSAWLSSLRGMRLFSRADYPNLKQSVKPGQLTVFDLSGITQQKKKQIILGYFAQKLFAGRQKEKVPPFMLLVEEAHNFAREKAPKGGAISRHIIETIAREGRKFGASLCLVSQRPVQLSTTALSQCNTFMIFRITNPYDLDHIKQSCEAIDVDSANAITTLRVGEGIVIGEAVNHPLFVRVRLRKAIKTGKSVGLADLARNFEQNSVREMTVEDAEGFI